MPSPVLSPPEPLSVSAKSHEFLAGMEVFYTGTAPLGGKLRTEPNDFVVEELGGRPRLVDTGKHLAVKLRLTTWEHNHFIRDASRVLKMGRNAVGFAGTKDKRAVTTQWMTFLSDRPDEWIVDRLASIPRVEVLEHFRTERGLRLGMHEGNRFRIRVRRVMGAVDDVRSEVDATLSAFDRLGGFPNFFGIQRFGAARPNTHLVGERLVRGDVEGAVLQYIAGTVGTEADDLKEVRAVIERDRDWKAAQRLLPYGLHFERAMVQHLAGHPDDYLGALRSLPRNLVLLFIHAYQSYLFNRILSERIRARLPLDRAVVGDIILPAVGGEPPKNADPIPVTSDNLEKVNRQVAKRRAVVTAPLPGLTSPLAEGAPGAIESKILDEAKVTRADFRNLHVPEATSNGLRRGILTPVYGLGWNVTADPDAPEKCVVELSFELPPGVYATSLLREVMKAGHATQY